MSVSSGCVQSTKNIVLGREYVKVGAGEGAAEEDRRKNRGTCRSRRNLDDLMGSIGLVSALLQQVDVEVGEDDGHLAPDGHQVVRELFEDLGEDDGEVFEEADISPSQRRP